jgi:hypothetical protein
MPVVSFEGMSFSGFTWTFKLVSCEHPETSIWHAKPFDSTLETSIWSHWVIRLRKYGAVPPLIHISL